MEVRVSTEGWPASFRLRGWRSGVREISDYGGVDFGQFSLHLKGGDANDLPHQDVMSVLDQWTTMIQNRAPANRLQDSIIQGSSGLDYLVEAPRAQDVYDRKIYIRVLKSRPQPQPMTFEFRFDFETPETRRASDTKKWWRRLLG